jgi:hypothetical protein
MTLVFLLEFYHGFFHFLDHVWEVPKGIKTCLLLPSFLDTFPSLAKVSQSVIQLHADNSVLVDG